MAKKSMIARDVKRQKLVDRFAAKRTALISINLAVLNALPLPMLDGGQFALLLIEGLRGRPLPQRFQMAFMQSGFVLLMGLSLVLIVKDTSQLPAIQQLLGH